MGGIYPLSGAFMVIALMGLLISGISLTGALEATPIPTDDYDVAFTWAFTMMFLFGLMFIASVISMTYGPEGHL